MPAGGQYYVYPGTGTSQDPESLALSGSNVQEVSITDLISEGPIEGLVNGEASIYIAGDQLSDISTASIGSSTPNSVTDEVVDDTELLISIPAASGLNQPVTATIKDKGGTTAYLKNREVTHGNAQAFSWLKVEKVFSHKVRVHKFVPSIEYGDLTHPGYAHIIAWDGSQQGFFKDYWKVTSFGQQNDSLYNLKPTAKIVSSSGETLYGSVILLYDDIAFTQVNNGTGITVPSAHVRFYRPYRNSLLEKDVWANSTNEVTVDFHMDFAASADVKLDSGNKVIYIPKWTDQLGTVTNKKYELGEEQTTKSTSVASAGGTPETITKKYPGSSFEFRVGNVEQKPLSQLGGIGVASFPVTLTQAQAAPFTNDTTTPTTFAASYPTSTELAALKTAGAVSQIITFSESFSGAQINEIDEVTIHFEFGGGHYAAMEDGTEKASGAAFNIKVYASETGGVNASDWVDITIGDFNYHILAYGMKKTAVSYIVTLDISTHLRLSDLRLEITRLTPNGQSRDNPSLMVKQGGFLKNVFDDEVVSVIDSVKINQIVATIKEKLSYPFSAMASVNFSSKSFASPPKRAYHVRGLKLAIPGNYTPRHLSATGKAVYTGIWNGEFSNEGASNASGLDLGTYYTDNPAWIFYDILVNNRYGLGKFLQAQDINSFQLYRIAKYCDEEVPTTDGGVEPRFTANLYLTKATEAYKVLKDMATIFRGMVYWLDGQMTTVPDMPATPIYNFSLDNIIEESLSTESTGSKTRTNQFTVIWNNPNAGYKQEPLVVEDKQNIIDTKRIINKKAVAFGCTSEGQALRFGRWKAWTAINQTEVAKFKTSINASFLRPGDVVNLQDVNSTGIAFSGRITNSTNSAITLDKDIASISDEAQTDGGRTRQYEFGTTGNGFSYKLALLVLVRKVISAQDTPIVVTHGGSTYTYNRGDEVSFAKVNGTSTVLINASDSDEQIEKNILNVEDNDGNLVILQFQNSTTVETKDFDSTDVSVVNGVTQIAISSQYSGTIPDNTVWSIREISSGANTTPSYKEYKILGLKEDRDKNWEISAVEFYNSKYEAVDKDFILGVQDPANPPEPDFVPSPTAIYLLNASDHRTQLEELIIQWETPRNSDGTLYESVAMFMLHIDPPLPDGTDLVAIKNPQQRAHRVLKIPNGVYNFGVQTFSSESHKRSKIKWAAIDIFDKYKVSCPRTKEGVPASIRTNAKSSSAKNDSTSAGTTWSLSTKDWAIQSAGAPGVTVNNANQSTAATYQQVVTSMATNGKEITAAFIYFDADDTTDYFKLVTHTIFKCQNTTVKYWQEYDQFASNSENVWTDCTNNADARVKLHKYSNKVEKSEGTTAFTTRFQVGDIIRIKTASNVYYGGKVALIESDDVLFTDVQLNETGADLTSVDESKAIARNALRTDVATDAVIARINRSGNNYTHIALKGWEEDTTLQGLRALIIDSNVAFLNYNSSSALQNEIAITLTADALAYDDPEFIITGNGFTQGSPAVSGSAQSSYIDSSNNAVTGQTLTYQIHDGSGGIGYDNGSSLDFSVTVREATDESESKTKAFKIVKVQDGSIGLDGKTARLDLSDYSLMYDDEGQGPKFTGTTSVGGSVGEVALAAPPASETNGWIKITVNTTNFTDPVFRIYYGSSPTYLVDSYTQHSGWMDGSGGESHVVHYPVPTGYSTPITSGSINLNVDVAEKPTNFNGSNLPASSDIKATDSTSLVSVIAGEVGRTIVISNPSHTFQAANNGTVATGAKTGSGTTIEFLKGGTVARYIGGSGSHSYNSGSSPSPNEWRIKSAVSTDSNFSVGTPTGVSNNVVTIGNHTVSGAIDDTEIITYTIELGTAAGVKEYKAVQAFTKSIAGASGDSVTGPEGKKTVQGYLYHEKTGGSHASAPAAPAGNTYTISTGVVSGTGIGTGTNVWTNSPRPQAPDAASTTHYTVRYFGTQTSSTTEITVSYSAVSQYTNFTGVVTFDSGTGLFAEGATTIQTGIDGGAITTGSIQNSTYVSTSGATGVRLNLDATGSNAVLEAKSSGTALVSINADGSATFGGTVNATAGFVGATSANGWTISGSLLLGGGTAWPNVNVALDGGSATPRIIIRDPTAGINHVVLGKLG